MWIYYCVGGILLTWFESPTVWEEKVTDKAIKFFSEWSPLSFDETFPSNNDDDDLLQENNILMMCMTIMWMKCYGIAVTTSDTNWITGRFRLNMFVYSVLHHYHQSTKERRSLDSMVFDPSSLQTQLNKHPCMGSSNIETCLMLCICLAPVKRK